MSLLPKCDLEAILATLPVGWLVLDSRLTLIAVGREFSDLLGHTDGLLLGRPFGTLVVADHRAELTPLLDSSAATGVRIQAGLKTASGEPLDVSLAFSRLPDDGATPPCLLGLVLHPGRHQDRDAGCVGHALSLAGVATWILDCTSGRVTASQNWYDIWGLAAFQDVDLDLCLNLIHPSDRAIVQSALEHICVLEPQFRVRFRIRQPDDRLRWLEASGHLDASTDGHHQRISGAVIDVTERQDIEQDLARFRDIVSAMPDRVALVDRGCRLLAVNPSFLRAVGCPEAGVIERPFKDVGVSDQLCGFLYSNLGHCLDRGQPLLADIHEKTLDGRHRESEVRLFPHLDRHGKTTGIVIDIRDVTALREAQRRLLQSAAVYSATSEGVLITDRAGTIIAVNSAFTQITGYTESEAIGQRPDLLGSQWHPRSFFIGMWRTLLRHGSWQGEIWNRRKNGEVYRQRLTTRRVTDSRGKVVNFVCVFAERSALPLTPQRAEHLLHYDVLTKLPNRLLLESRLEHALDIGRRKESRLAVFVIDIDHFSHINTSLGHQIGDELLRAIALRLREAIRPADTLARLRADQFGLLFEDLEDGEEFADIAQRLLSLLHRAFQIRDHQVFVTASIGIVDDPGPERDHQAMIARAEATLRRVKRQGRNGFLIAPPDTLEQIGEHKRMMELLRAARENGQCRLLYRPRVDMESGAIDAIEAAIQWEEQEVGTATSDRYSQVANDTRLMVELGQWSLKTACSQLQGWLRLGMSVKSLVIEISEAHLAHGDLLRQLDHLLIENPDVRHRLELAFSESLLVRHCEQIVELFDGLHRRGIAILLQDVGTGWTSPPVLQRLPLRALQIHPTFIVNLPESQHDLAVVQTVIAMAQALDIEVIADGIRTPQQRLLLLNIGCQRALGDLLGRSMSAEQLVQLPDINPRPNPPTSSRT